MKNNLIELINISYGIADGDIVYKEVQKIIVLSLFPDDMLAGTRFTHFFFQHIAPSGAVLDIPLVTLAHKLKLILGEFETDISGKEDTVLFIHRILLRQIRNES